ncbi:MAG: preprotein translocase subunit SecE [Solirubrobacteraceae bacterium]
MARDRKRAKQRRARQSGRPAARSKSPSRQSTPLGPERRSTVDPPEPTDEISGDAELAKQAARGAPTDDVDHPVDDPDAKAEVFADELSDGAAGGGVLSDLAGDEEREVPDDDDASPEEPVFPDPATTGGGGKRGGGGGKRGDDADGGGGGAGKSGGKAEGARRPGREPATRSEGNRVIAFLHACWAELQRVQWPDRRAVSQATAVVLGFVVIAGSFLGLMDFVWQKVVTALLDL